MLDRMRRRGFVAAIAAAAFRGWKSQSVAQPRTTLPRVGILTASSAGFFAPLFAAMRTELAAHGYSDGLAVEFDVVYANGESDRLATLARELVLRRPDVIVAHTTDAAHAVAAAT